MPKSPVSRVVEYIRHWRLDSCLKWLIAQGSHEDLVGSCCEEEKRKRKEEMVYNLRMIESQGSRQRKGDNHQTPPTFSGDS